MQIERRKIKFASFKTEILLFCLGVVTVLSLFINPYLVSVTRLDINEHYSEFLTDKGESHHGLSEGEFLNGSNKEFICHLKKSNYNFPFCSLKITLSDSLEKGIDLSNYVSITLDIDYRGPGETVRLYMRTFDPRYSAVEDEVSTKYNFIEFEKALLESPFEINFDRFGVPSWWVNRYKIPFHVAGRDFSNVVLIQLQTGSKAPLGKHYFRIKNIYANKPYISAEGLYLAIIFIWLSTIFSIISYKLYKARAQLHLQRYEARKLEVEKRELAIQSNTDTLTGVLNRRGLDRALEKALLRFREDGEVFSLILFDIDKFKVFNDRYGHALGDEVLVGLCALVDESLRARETLGRWGGEEFLILSRQTDLKSASRLAESLCSKVADFSFDNGFRITCSFGVTTACKGDTLEHLFNRADKALFSAKRAGRNQVKLYDSHY